MTSVYKAVMRGSGIASAMAVTGWLVAAAISLSDGPAGIEVPRWLSTAGVMVIVCGTVIAAGAWVVERGHHIAAEKQTRPVVRQELAAAFAEMMPLLVATVVEAVGLRAHETAVEFGDRLDGQIHDAAELAAKQTAARMREAHTADLSEICHDLHRKTLIAGQIMQANSTGEAIGRAALRSVSREFVSTSRGD